MSVPDDARRSNKLAPDERHHQMTQGVSVEALPVGEVADHTGGAALVEVRGLLRSSSGEAREQAWDAFIARYSRLLLHIASLVMPDQDGVMDAYAYTIEQLRQHEFRALRSYVETDKCRFSTWLAVVARRSCVDFHRHRYGRSRHNDSAQTAAERAGRQRLMNLAGVSLDLTQLPQPNGHGPERELRNAELQRALDAALAELSADDRLLLKLRFEDDLSAQVIAPVVGLPSPFHVYRRIKAVCQQLKRRLAERGVDDGAP